MYIHKYIFLASIESNLSERRKEGVEKYKIETLKTNEHVVAKAYWQCEHTYIYVRYVRCTLIGDHVGKILVLSR